MTAVRPKVPLGELFLRALYGRDIASALKIGATLLERRRDDLSLMRAMARLLTETGDLQAASPYWRRIHELEPGDLEACFHGARAALNSGADVQAALDQVCQGEAAKLAPVLLPILRSPPSPPANQAALRHIAIGGVSFCGSTLLDRIMGGLPGVRSIGESHWLVKSYRNSIAAPLDFRNGEPVGAPQCSVCGTRCTVLTNDFRARLAADRTNWYFRIAERLGTGVLVSADKNPPKLVENDPLLRMDTVILFKSPAQAWASQLSKLPKDKDADFYKAELEKYILLWCKSYETFLHYFRPAGKTIFVSFDEFAAHPDAVAPVLCAGLGLEFDAQVLARTVPGHAIGGNSRAMAKLREHDYAVKIMPLGEPDIPGEHARTIAAHPRINEVHAQLLERFGRLLADHGSRGGSSAAPSAAGARRDRVQRFEIERVKAVHYDGIFGDFATNIAAHLTVLEKSRNPASVIKAGFFRHLLDNVDRKAFAAIQHTYVNSEMAQLGDRLKYIDPVHWFDAKLNAAMRIDLHKLPPKSILDIGTGPGHFPAIAQYFGHRVLGTDLPLRPELPDQSRHLYDALCELYGVRKTPLRINAFKPLPDFGEKFDLLTGFMAAFNVFHNQEPWSAEAWRFFFASVNERVLRPEAKIYLQLTNGKTTEESWASVAGPATWCNPQSKFIYIEDVETYLRSLNAAGA